MTSKKNKQAVNLKNLSRKQIAAIAAVIVGILLLMMPAKPLIVIEADDSTGVEATQKSSDADSTETVKEVKEEEKVISNAAAPVVKKANDLKKSTKNKGC